MFYIPELLSLEQCAQVRELLGRGRFVDGRHSAGASVDYRKRNLQGEVGDPAIAEAQQLVYAALNRHPHFTVLALPRHVRPMVFNRYDVGMYYHDHMDHALLPGEPPIRGDMSVTVFLSALGEYDGGELVVNSDRADGTPVKLPQGHAVVYSAATMHRVNPVTRGTRWGAVTTVQSRIRRDDQRELMGLVSQLTSWVQDVAPRSPEEDMANKLYTNLLRLWDEA